MAHDAAKRQEARSLYVFKRLPLTTAAERAGVHGGTVRRWKKAALEAGDDWDRARTAASLAGQSGHDIVLALVEDFVGLHQNVLDELKTAPDIAVVDKARMLAMLADAFTKTMNAAGKASPDISRLAVAQDVIKRLGDFVASRFPQHGAAFLEILEPFGQELAGIYDG